MTILPIITAPDSRLTITSFPVEKIDDEIRTFMDNMVETMYDANGIGLAAVQVGVHKRILVIDLQDPEQYGEGPLYIINPEITSSSNTVSSYEEGCLSFPGQSSNVIRPETVTVRYLDYNGTQQTLEAQGLLATCIQHEIDHLNGIVFIDHISRLKRDMILRKIAKIKKATPD